MIQNQTLNLNGTMAGVSNLKLSILHLLSEMSKIDVNETYYSEEPKASHYNPNYRQTGASKRILREFKVKGEVVMAYNKKDALKRLNRKKK